MLNIITTPTVINDALFNSYGGQTGTSTVAQRQAAYAIAEGQAAQEIGTFLSPTRYTGTYTWPVQGRAFNLDHTRIRGIVQVVAVHDSGCNCAADSIELTGCAWLKHAQAGVIEVRECGNTIRASCSGCNCGQGGNGAFQVRVVYDAGLPTGAHLDPRLQMGLVTAADLALEQIIDPAGAEGGPGDTGVQSFSSAGYSETRTPLRMTAFGSSARANYAANMLSNFKFKRAGKLGF